VPHLLLLSGRGRIIFWQWIATAAMATPAIRRHSAVARRLTLVAVICLRHRAAAGASRVILVSEEYSIHSSTWLRIKQGVITS
jgi:hypothetical protein